MWDRIFFLRDRLFDGVGLVDADLSMESNSGDARLINLLPLSATLEGSELEINFTEDDKAVFVDIGSHDEVY
ncbi:MAG: hypothetical protein SW833_17835 [Cyanobacteriota bacterium]|nr:hypothetical protein [Cyanobacteriota bacterium]